MATKLMDGLFLGDATIAQDVEFLVSSKITRVINCAGNTLRNCWDRIGIRYLTYRWAKNERYIFDDEDKVLDQIYGFIAGAFSEGESVLVHSYDGRSRCAAVACAFFMKKYSWSLKKTMTFMHLKNEELRPLPHFVKQLKAMERRICKRLLSVYKVPKKELELRANMWQTPETNDIIRSPYNRNVFVEHLGSDDTILVNTYLNSQPTMDSYFDLGHQTEVKRKKDVKLTWLDLKNSKIGIERPPSASYNSLKPGKNWSDVSTRSHISTDRSIVRKTSEKPAPSTSTLAERKKIQARAASPESILKGGTKYLRQHGKNTIDVLDQTTKPSTKTSIPTVFRDGNTNTKAVEDNKHRHSPSIVEEVLHKAHTKQYYPLERRSSMSGAALLKKKKIQQKTVTGKNTPHQFSSSTSRSRQVSHSTTIQKPGRQKASSTGTEKNGNNTLPLKTLRVRGKADIRINSSTLERGKKSRNVRSATAEAAAQAGRKGDGSLASSTTTTTTTTSGTSSSRRSVRNVSGSTRSSKSPSFVSSRLYSTNKSMTSGLDRAERIRQRGLQLQAKYKHMGQTGSNFGHYGSRYNQNRPVSAPNKSIWSQSSNSSYRGGGNTGYNTSHRGSGSQRGSGNRSTSTTSSRNRVSTSHHQGSGSSISISRIRPLKRANLGGYNSHGGYRGSSRRQRPGSAPQLENNRVLLGLSGTSKMTSQRRQWQ